MKKQHTSVHASDSFMTPLSSEELEDYILDFAKNYYDSEMKAYSLGILLRANSAVCLETL